LISCSTDPRSRCLERTLVFGSRIQYAPCHDGAKPPCKAVCQQPDSLIYRPGYALSLTLSHQLTCRVASLFSSLHVQFSRTTTIDSRMDGLRDDTALSPPFSPDDAGDKSITMKRERKAREDTMLERIRRSYAEYKKAHPDGDLCQRCASIDWSLLLPSDASYYCEAYNHLELFSVPESSQELRALTCPLCLLLSLKQDQTVRISCACYELCRLDGGPTAYHRQYDWTHHALCLDVKGRLSRNVRYMLQDARANTQHYVLRKLAPELIDYEILRYWLRHCQRHHHTECNPNCSSSIPGHRVFDCKAGEVVAAPENTTFPYIALSYVWGGVGITSREPEEFPATVRDAITVTLKLGYRYLWIDQLVRSCTSDERCDLY